MLPSELNQKYELRGSLGRGAMGVVYEALDRFLGRSVAIKVVKRQRGMDAEGIEADQRFRREAQAAGRFTHPNIVLVYDYGENADQAWIVMEKVEGGSLKDRFDRKERFPLPEIVRIMDEILRGLAYAHGHGVAAHRDIKPANIMLTHDGTVKIADFGIARTEGSHLTQIGALIGTPAYMAPEQFRGEPVDLRTDIWAAGVVLYQLLTDEKPFDGANPATVMHRVLNTEPQPPSIFTVTAPRAFDGVIARALAKRPEDRFPTALAFAEAIRAAAASRAAEPPAPRPGDQDATVYAPSGQSLPPLPGLGPNDDATMGSLGSSRRPDPTPRSVPPPQPEAGGGGRKALFAVLGLAVLGGAGAAAWFGWQTEIRQLLHLAPGTTEPRTDAPLHADTPPGTATPPRTDTPPGNATPPRTDTPPGNATPPRTDTPPGTATPPRTDTPPGTATPPRTDTPPGTATPPRTDTPPGNATPPRTDTPPGTATPPRTDTPPGTATPPRTDTPPGTATPPRTDTPPGTATPPRTDARPPLSTLDTPTNPVGPRLGAVELRAAGQAAALTPCSLLTWSATDQILTIRGVLRRSDVASLGRMLVSRGAPDAATRLEIQPFDGPYCDALELFRPVLGAFGAAPVATLQGQSPLASGERIRIAIEAPEWASHLYVGYLDTEGRIAHLVMARAMRPRERLVLGENETYTVGPPFGTDLVVVISSEQPLFGPEPLSERFADFLPVLSRQLAAQMQRQQRISMRPLVVETVERRR